MPTMWSPRSAVNSTARQHLPMHLGASACRCGSPLAGVARRLVFRVCAGRTGPTRSGERAAWLYRLLVNKYYFDWFNENVLARPAGAWDLRFGAGAIRR